MLTISGANISATGGIGGPSGSFWSGGGSGGGIFLHADTVTLTGTNVLNVAGGGSTYGGGGGAGQIAILTNNYSNSGSFNTSGGISAAGSGGSFTFNGPGSLHPASTPEPSSLALLGLMAGGFALRQYRKRKTS